MTRCDPSDPFIENLLKTLVPLEDQKDPEKMAQARRALEFGQAFPKKGKNLSQDFLRRTSSTDPDSCKCQIKFSMSSIELGAWPDHQLLWQFWDLIQTYLAILFLWREDSNQQCKPCLNHCNLKSIKLFGPIFQFWMRQILHFTIHLTAVMIALKYN